MTKKPRGRPRLTERPVKDNYVQREEHILCRTKDCRNVIAMWSTGPASNGYCAVCRGETR